MISTQNGIIFKKNYGLKIFLMKVFFNEISFLIHKYKVLADKTKSIKPILKKIKHQL